MLPLSDQFVPKQLGQLKPANTTAASLYSPPVRSQAVLTSLIVCNNTSGDVSYRVFLDDDGTTYDTTTALFYDSPLMPQESDVIEFMSGLPMFNTAGNIAVRTSTNDAITFTLHGYERIY